MAEIEIINPDEWKPPVGYSNAVAARGGRTVFFGGQVAFDENAAVVVAGDLVTQFTKTLENLDTVVRAAGGTLQDVVKLTIFVQDRDDYRAHARELGGVWRERFGKHFPAMTLVEVARFYESDVLVEIEGIAVLD